MALGLIGLDPVLAKYANRRLDAFTLLLLDDSASMSLADRYRRPEDALRAQAVAGALPREGVTRAAIVEKLLTADDGRLLKALAGKNPVKLFTFSDAPTLRATYSSPDSEPPQVRLKAAGPATDAGLAVRAAIESAAGSPIAAVVLLSDGGLNQGEPGSAIAAYLRQKGIPLHTVGIGDPSPPQNASVVEVSGPRSVFKNDPFRLRVRIAATGVEPGPIHVELLEQRGAGEAKVVESRSVSPDAGGRFEPVVFERRLDTPGSVGYAARIQPLEYEAVLTDNRRQLVPAVQVLDDRMRVLLIAGSPTYDYRYLARMLERDKTVDVACWLQSADARAVRDGDIPITQLPADQKELFRYDAIILIDCDPAELEPTWGSLVATFVSDHGGGLLVAAGNKFTGRFLRSPQAASLVAILPIVPDPDAEILLNDLGQYQTKSWPILIPESALTDPILTLTDGAARNAAIWSALEGIYWHYPIRRAKPVANVLMRHSNPRMVNDFGSHVLLATQYVGSGRSAFLGFDSTWRWRRGDEKVFNRFWMQMLRFLVEGRLSGGPSRCQIITARNEYELGESIVLTVRALDEQYAPLMRPEIDVAVSSDDHTSTGEAEKTVRLTPIPGREGYFEGRLVAERAGTLRLAVRPPPGSGEPQSGPPVVKELMVVQPDLEMRSPAMNREALEQFAAAAGGRYFDVDQADQLGEAVQDRSRTFVIRERPRPLWDNGYVLSLLLTALIGEWILRKKAKLL